MSSFLCLVRLLLLVVSRSDFLDAAFVLLFLKYFAVSVYTVFCVLCRRCGSCFTYVGTVTTSFLGHKCVSCQILGFLWGFMLLPKF